MSIKQLKTDEDFKEVLVEDQAILFKHSLTCPISSEAKDELESFLNKHNMNAFIIHIQDNRELSNEVADHFQIKHESPQVFWLTNGIVKDHSSHWHITVDKLEEMAK
ncbi:bacillithiol system redox-active protein YtxJ [Halalkalibacillus halophilus]|uniref:bacillithiol system redox-active protein YtxJ n=1 Tax=Halalkalibacillus halophilus TaxID=392827 RepID=UPI0003F783DA|nr:bacillithiol system redox-active protein YtxJ [Halalkalibacillus halophilus]